ncbi:MAG: hypothetical protein II208_02555 [Alphaproteobacteria bacterium]|nr:hypothetical protein [Alphaproteobacteria bacterium]
MIQDGDLFTVSELKESVSQVTEIGGRRIKYANFTPQQYADKSIELYRDIRSSAIQLDDSLRKAGFRTTYRFAYDYNIPGLGYDEIINDAYKLECFYKVACQVVQKTGAFPKDSFFDDAARVSYYYAQYIWAANSKVRFDYQKKLDVYCDWGRVLCFLLGVGFKFHPNDVYEFVIKFNSPDLNDAEMRAERQKQQRFKDWCAQSGVDTGCLVLSDAHRDKLRRIINGTDTPYFLQLLALPFKSR